MSSREVFENSVASIVDVASIMLAYRIGIQQSSIEMGFAYGIFDAIIVVWMRRPISRAIHRIFTFGRARQALPDAYQA